MSKAKTDRDAISLLKNDHQIVKDLFEEFGESESPSEVQKIIEEAIHELKIHATIEEEIFYPAIREGVGDDLMDEAREEHHVARVLIAELDALKDDRLQRDTKFKVLAEAVRHHIKEEEGEIFPRAKRLDMDFDALGGQMMHRKGELQKKGVPADAEHQMVFGIPAPHGEPFLPGRQTPAPREKTSAVGGRTPNTKANREKARK